VLAYLFFHRPGPNADVAAYDDGLRRFHAALASAQVPGFAGSRTYRVGDRYCDWYLVQTSASLDALNDAAVSGARASSHDAVARAAVDGEGKLLRLAGGAYDAGAPLEARFSKPRGMSYPDLYRRLQEWTSRPGFSLWRRMMVLGPAPEFVMLGPSDPGLPADMNPETFRREPLIDPAS
jgi:hypothetical protein